uniref:interleukin-4 receptor subunit alpha-like n=1 Tax=Podarcis muralis TaxID=64176 RepID=UPI00109F2C34|nr:interleukin-4 receptor subunit alpha-like [Podarcis muralis]XP_028561841.1 interleukin-4 receptor subunit alpha-like [Podarcis muralis]XP_028561843.1 interleukin-4 receptor subunit alpha-like [Podarcis muralis]XP_028561844.1 interleukin-4 receptor subunit alpha-like [Podarcis muralis]XP_028561845.1 interleukin-4 receptor subunit alpha-like [Podarcis muralis]
MGRTGFGGPRGLASSSLSVFLACSLWHTISSKDIQPRCFTDYDSEVGCSWEVDASTDCPKKFLLRVTANNRFSGQKKSWECSPKNKRGLDVTPKCTCTIRSEVRNNFKYRFSLEANGKKIWKTKIEDLRKIVKPRQPVNLKLTMGDGGYILTWEDGYNEGSILHKNSETDYEVAFGQEGMLEDEARKRMTTDMQLKIAIGSLMPATIHFVKVRQKNYFLGNTWSDWSIPISWKTAGWIG